MDTSNGNEGQAAQQSGFPTVNQEQQVPQFTLGTSKDGNAKNKVKSTTQVAEARLQEAYGTIGESTNIKREREDYAI